MLKLRLLQLFSISFLINELQHTYTKHMHFWQPTVQQYDDKYHRPFLKHFFSFSNFLALSIISPAVTGNTSVPVHPIEAYLEEEIEQENLHWNA